jgi:hypothetical protein
LRSRTIADTIRTSLLLALFLFEVFPILREISLSEGSEMPERTMNKNDALHTHLWSDGSTAPPPVEQYGRSILHHRCVLSWRDFAQGIAGTFDWQAATSELSESRLLGPEVNERWLSEPCPGERVPPDDEYRATRRS